MKINYGRFVRFFTGTMIYLMVVCGCGSTDSNSASKSAYNEDFAAEEAAEGGVYEAAYDENYETEEAGDLSNGEQVTNDPSASKQKRKLITNMSMNTETKEFDKTVDFLKSRTDELGGYVESFSTDKSSYSDERTARFTLRIPEEKLSGFVNEVATESNITSQEMNVTDVTLTYADLESHRNALRAEEEQLLVLMDRAETIEDIMSIQDKLTDVRYRLESMESQLRTYDNQITFSTLNVTVREVIEYTPEPVKNPSFWERAQEGFIDNCEAVGTFFKELSLLIITHLPVLIILIVFAGIIIVIVRFADKKNREKRANRQPVNMGYPAGTYNQNQGAPMQGVNSPYPVTYKVPQPDASRSGLQNMQNDVKAEVKDPVQEGTKNPQDTESER